MRNLLTYLRRLFTSSWVVADPDPQPSWLDRKDGVWMGDIGDDQREYELEPITAPVVIPIETPSTPEKVPA